MRKLLHFNSIKVRLELSSAALNYAQESFQFHKGAIRTLLLVLVLLVLFYFNSIKVRLEQKDAVIMVDVTPISIP